MIDYQATLIEGRLISRYKRFFADIDTGDGVITAHCANTGRMTGLIEEGSRVWFRKQPSGRKLGFAWELVEVSSDMACINTTRANELLSSTDLSFLIPGVSFFRREPKVGSHRLDLELSREGQPVYVEIKSVTLCEDQGVGLFPDAPSERRYAACQSAFRNGREWTRNPFGFCRNAYGHSVGCTASIA